MNINERQVFKFKIKGKKNSLFPVLLISATDVGGQLCKLHNVNVSDFFQSREGHYLGDRQRVLRHSRQVCAKRKVADELQRDAHLLPMPRLRGGSLRGEGSCDNPVTCQALWLIACEARLNVNVSLL